MCWGSSYLSGLTLTLVLLVGTSCGDGILRPSLEGHEHSILVEPGNRYRLALDKSHDQAELGTRWVSGDFAGSPMAWMQRPALVFKADDFGRAFSKEAVRFVELLDDYRAPASLGIITSYLPAEPRVLDVYRYLHESGAELWFHGHSHYLQGSGGEFRGRSSHEQARSFAEGQSLAKSKLGIQFHTFGAPGNKIDELTPGVVAQYPRIKVWLFGLTSKEEQALVLPRHVSPELSIGRMVSIRELEAMVESMVRAQHPITTLQVHPLQFGDDDFDRLEALMELLKATQSFRFTTPYGYWRWMKDLGRLHLTKTDDRTYILDTTRAQHPHRLSLSPELGAFELKRVSDPTLGERLGRF